MGFTHNHTQLYMLYTVFLISIISINFRVSGLLAWYQSDNSLFSLHLNSPLIIIVVNNLQPLVSLSPSQILSPDLITPCFFPCHHSLLPPLPSSPFSTTSPTQVAIPCCLTCPHCRPMLMVLSTWVGLDNCDYEGFYPDEITCLVLCSRWSCHQSGLLPMSSPAFPDAFDQVIWSQWQHLPSFLPSSGCSTPSSIFVDAWSHFCLASLLSQATTSSPADDA